MFKVIFVLLVMIGSLIIPANAQVSSEFGYQLHPEKLLENTVGDLQIYVVSNNMMVPKNIQNLKVVSSDTDVIEILEVNEEGYTNNIKIKANTPGVVTIALAAQGFVSKEITLEVFNNNNFPTQLLMKTTPEIFPIDGPKHGYIALELATTGGLPTPALEDVEIKIDTPNKDVIELKNSTIIVPKGEYYAITEFTIIGSGDAIIFAETNGMNKISSIVNVLEAEGPLKLQLYVFPETFNSFSATSGYAIVQLLDNENNPVLAENDINFKLGVENLDVSYNKSHDFEEVIFANNELTIMKGEYSTVTEFSPRPDISSIDLGTGINYEMYISANNILTSGDSFTVTHADIGALEGEGPSVTKTLPFLTTGKKEMIAVTYYETSITASRQIGGTALTYGEEFYTDDEENPELSPGQAILSENREFVTLTIPVQADNDHEMGFSSSNKDVINPINPIMKKGENAVIVYGETGTVASDDEIAFYITDNEGVKTESVKAIGPIEDDIALVVEPLLPIILAENQFQALAYLEDFGEKDEEVVIITDEDEEDADPRLGVTPFIEDAVLTFSANDEIETDSLSIKKNQPYAIVNMMSNEVGTTTLSYQMGGFDGSVDIVSHTTDPAIIHLGVIDNLLTNSNNLVTLQLLDSAENPVYTKKNIKIELVSNNESILKTSEEIIIKEGEYFQTIELETFGEGTIELALLSEDLPLSKYEINVIDISPVLSLNLLGGLGWNERIEAKLAVTIPEIETSLDGFQVEWIAEGGEVKTMDSETNSEGIATLNIIANDKDKVTVTAKVTGNGLSGSTTSKTADILNMPVIEEGAEATTETTGIGLDIGTLLLVIIPVAVGGALFFLKRMDKLDLITDKIPIGDKVEEIKEKIMDIRNR